MFLSHGRCFCPSFPLSLKSISMSLGSSNGPLRMGPVDSLAPVSATQMFSYLLGVVLLSRGSEHSAPWVLCSSW